MRKSSELNNKLSQVLIHVSGCITFLLLPILFSPDFGSQRMFSIPPFQKDFFNFVLLIGVFYLSYYYLVPRFFFRKKYFVFILLVLVTYVLAAFLPDWIIPHKRMPPPERLRPPLHHFGNMLQVIEFWN